MVDQSVSIEELRPAIEDSQLSEEAQRFKLLIDLTPAILKKVLSQTNQTQLFSAIKDLSLPDDIKRSVSSSCLKSLCTAIINVIHSEDSSPIDPLLERLVDIIEDTKLIEGLERAIQKKDIRTVRSLLLENPQLVTVKDMLNMTALHYALSQKAFVAAIILIKHGASLDDKDPLGLPARKYARAHGPNFLNLLESAAAVIENTRISNNPHRLLKNPYQDFAKAQEKNIFSEPPAKRPKTQ